MDVSELCRIDRAVVALATPPRTGEKIRAVQDAWIELDDRAQATKLHYFREDMTYGATLRAALDMAVSAGRDLGAEQSDRDMEKGRAWL